MPPTPVTPPGRGGCSACENTTPGSRDKTSATSYSSGSVGRALGRRSLDTFRSVRGSLRGRNALSTATNQKSVEPLEPDGPATSASAGSSPVSPPAKQRWYDSLRSRASHIPTPSSPTSASVSSTLKRTRFFRSSPTQITSPDSPFSVEQQKQPTRAPPPLPRLEISSFQSELQRLSIFGDRSDKTTGDTKLKIEACGNRKRSSEAKMDSSVGREPVKPGALAPGERKIKPSLSLTSAEKKGHSPVIAAITELKAKSSLSSENTEPKPRAKVAFADVAKEVEEEWLTQCALYYKGSPWQTERTETFPDASSALSHLAIHKMLDDRRHCSNVLLWTGQIPYTNPKTKQTFTIYPHYDGPRRIEIEERYCLEWAFIAFTDGTKATRLPPTRSKVLSEEDARLMAALKSVIQMGYHVDVWTCRDNENWDFDVDCVRDFGMKKLVAQRQQSEEAVERRKRYQAFIRHGVAGFSQSDIDLLFSKLDVNRKNEEEEDEYDYAHDGYEHEEDGVQQSRAHVQKQNTADLDSELNGYLEHQEETITEEGTDDDSEVPSSGDPEISIHSEDLDMAARLGE